MVVKLIIPDAIAAQVRQAPTLTIAIDILCGWINGAEEESAIYQQIAEAIQQGGKK